MNKRKTSGFVFAAALLVLTLMLSACDGSMSVMEINFNTDTAADSRDSKDIYVNGHTGILKLDASLKTNAGETHVTVNEKGSEEVLWSGIYEEDTDFTILLNDLEAGEELVLEVESLQAKSVNLRITSEDKLVKDAAKPDRYIVSDKN